MSSNRPATYKGFLYTPSIKKPRQTNHSRKKKLMLTLSNPHDNASTSTIMEDGQDNDILESSENIVDDFIIDDEPENGILESSENIVDDFVIDHEVDNGILESSENIVDDFIINDEPDNNILESSENIVDDFVIEDDILKEKLYDGCEYSLGEALEDILNIYLVNNITKKCLDDILTFINKYMPPNLMPKGKYYLENKFLKYLTQTETIKHHFCDSCGNYLGPENFKCDICQDDCKDKYFFEFCADSQIQVSLENGYLPADKMMLRHSLSQNSVKICDVVDGGEYKKLISPYRNENIISLIWNTDGIACSNSSHRQIWPILGHILELPPEIRYKYTFVFGMYVGEKKPNMNVYLRPFINKIKKINEEGGLKWIDPISKKEMCARLLAPVAAVDAPAKAEMQNMHHHNGECSCNICLAPGETIPVGRGYARIFRPSLFILPDDLSLGAVLRTAENMLAHAKEVITNPGMKHCFGIKGVSVLSLMPGFDLSTSFVLDYLHFLLEGLVKGKFNLWFDAAYSKEEWSLRDKIPQIDEFMKNIYPPDYIHRLPRSLQTRAYWKAQEFRNWLLFYSVPILKKFKMPDKFFNHWLLLVGVIFNLLKPEISPEDIEAAEKILNLYCLQLEILYPPNILTYNAHQLLHLPLCVRRFGPLWAYSTFSFESFNGIISKTIHSSQAILEQISKNFEYFMAYVIIKARNDRKNEEYENRCLGKPLSEQEVQNLPFLRSLEIEEGSNIFKKMLYKNQKFTSELYIQSLKRKNHFVIFLHNNEIAYGSILCYSQIGDVISAIVRVYKIIANKCFIYETIHFKVNHIIPVVATEEILIIPISSIQEKVLYIKNDNTDESPDFFCIRPNKIECNL